MILSINYYCMVFTLKSAKMTIYGIAPYKQPKKFNFTSFPILLSTLSYVIAHGAQRC